MKTTLRLVGYVLLGVGLAGLLLNEFAFGWGTQATILFAALEVIGFAALATARWAMK